QQGQSRSAQGARTLQYAPLSFDVSFQELFGTWCSGGTLVLTKEDVRRDFAALLRLIEAERIERIFVPPLALQGLATIAEEIGVIPASLREVIAAGEQLTVTPQVRRLFERLGGCALVNQYGPSEAH